MHTCLQDFCKSLDRMEEELRCLCRHFRRKRPKHCKPAPDRREKDKCSPCK